MGRDQNDKDLAIRHKIETTEYDIRQSNSDIRNHGTRLSRGQFRDKGGAKSDFGRDSKEKLAWSE